MAGRTQLLAAGAAAGAVLGAGALAAALNLSEPGSELHQLVLPRWSPEAAGRPGGAPETFAPILERVSPAVVSIYSTATVAPPQLIVPDLPFLGRPQYLPPMQAMSSGSGFFISADGYVVTNDHVVAGAQEVEVVLQDERRLKARLVGRDPATDLAVLKVDGGGFPFVSFAEAARPRVGDWVIAVGNPFGLGTTATAGIVSARGRDIGSTFVDYLQIDAPLNRGNSGGPTFDVHGRVVGVNTAILSPSGGFIGIGFAVPADVADKVTRRIIARRPVERGYLGATLQDVTPETAEALGLPAPGGALVVSVAPGGPAAAAGLQPGDVLTTVEGGRIVDAAAATRLVVRKDPGEVVHVGVRRNGGTVELSVRLGARPPEDLLRLGEGRP